jgi:coenzyme PQQ precursor peptide PqqA
MIYPLPVGIIGAQNHLVRAIRPGILPTDLITETNMSWETPQAIDMRWGFEITMYIANR